MGMDVYGRNPVVNPNSVKPEGIDFQKSSEQERDDYFNAVNKYENENPGVYFRANVWSWRPIHSLICKFCDEHLRETGKILIEDPVLNSMGMNEGSGPEEEWQCKELAKRFDKWMEHNVNGATSSVSLASTPEGMVVSALGGDETPSYSTNDEHLKEFVRFLENCGGFEVW